MNFTKGFNSVLAHLCFAFWEIYLASEVYNEVEVENKSDTKERGKYAIYIYVCV